MDEEATLKCIQCGEEIYPFTAVHVTQHGFVCSGCQDYWVEGEY